MILGQVVEAIVATDKHAALKGHHLFWVQPLSDERKPLGEPFIAVNAVGAGPGDTVVVCNEGTGCRELFDGSIFPVNHAIAGFVDAVDRV